MNIGARVQYYRKLNGLSLEDFAQELGMSISDVEAIEAGLRSLSHTEVQKIAGILKISIDDLFSQEPLPEDAEDSKLIPVDRLNELLDMMKD